MKSALPMLFACGGQGISKVCGMHLDELNVQDREWTLPRRRTKYSRGHLVPLTDTALQILDSIPRLNEYVFYSENSGYIRHHAIAYAVAKLRKEMDIPSFVARDIHRTVKTQMNEIGIPREITQRIHNHAFNDIDEQHYNRYDFYKEKRVARDKWDRYIRSILKDRILLPSEKQSA